MCPTRPSVPPSHRGEAESERLYHARGVPPAQYVSFCACSFILDHTPESALRATVYRSDHDRILVAFDTPLNLQIGTMPAPCLPKQLEPRFACGGAIVPGFGTGSNPSAPLWPWAFRVTQERLRRRVLGVQAIVARRSHRRSVQTWIRRAKVRVVRTWSNLRGIRRRQAVVSTSHDECEAE